MFGTNFKSSIFVLPWFLLPLAVLAAFVVFVDPWIQDYSVASRQVDGELEYDEGLEYDGDESFGEEDEESEEAITISYRWGYSRECFVISTIGAVVVNFLFLLIFPCALGGYDGGKKRFQFYLGFFINLAFWITLPLVYSLVYALDHTTLIILFGLHLVSYMATYIIGSRFVSPAYRKAFWFA